MSHPVSYAEQRDQKHNINLCNHERYPVHLKCLRNIQKIKYPDFQAMTQRYQATHCRYIKRGILSGVCTAKILIHSFDV